MTRFPNGSWSGDCLRDHEQGYTFMQVRERNCTLAQFDDYVKDFGTRLDLAIQRLDNETARTFATITTGMRSMIHRYVIDQIDEVADGITCGFMPSLVQEGIDGLCYQTLAGFRSITNSYFLCGLFIVLLAVDMYFLYRFVLSNVTVQRRQKANQLTMRE